MMKRGLFLKLSLFAMCVVCGVAVLCGVDVFELLFGGGGVCMAMAAGATIAQGDVTTSTFFDADPKLLADELDRVVIEETRDRTPINCIMKELKRKRRTGALKVEFFVVDEKPISAKVMEEYTALTTPSKVATIKVTNVSAFSKRDTIMIKGVKSYRGTIESVTVPLVCLVLERDDENGTIKIQPINGKENSSKERVFADSIPANAFVIRGAKAEHELSIRTEGSAQMPVRDENFCQNFMFELTMSDWAKLHDKNVDWGWSELFRMTLNDYAITKEISYLFGAKGLTKEATTGKEIYTCDGIFPKVTKTFSHGGTLDEQKMADLMQRLFDGNNGNPVRYAFLGSDLYLMIQKVDSIKKQIDGSKEPTVVFGLEFDRIKFGGNTLLLYKHPLLAHVGLSDGGLCLDMDNIEEREFKPFTKTDMDLRKSGQENADAVSVSEVTCPVVKNVDTHMIIMA